MHYIYRRCPGYTICLVKCFEQLYTHDCLPLQTAEGAEEHSVPGISANHEALAGRAAGHRQAAEEVCQSGDATAIYLQILHFHDFSFTILDYDPL